MKSDTTTTVLNFVLVLLAVSGVIFAILTFTRTREYRILTSTVNNDRAVLQQVESLVAQVEAYNKQVQSPELTRDLQPFTNPATK